MYDYKEHGKSIVPLLLRSDLVSDLFASSCFEIDREYNSYYEQHDYDSDAIDSDINYRTVTTGYEQLMIFIEDRI